MSTTSLEIAPVPRRIGLWSLQAIDAAAFFAAGTAKLMAVPFMVELFAQVGLGQWFRVATGLVEIIGALALCYPRMASVGGLWLSGTMFFAVLTHLFVLHTNPAPAAFLGLLSAAIAYMRRDELMRIARFVTDRF